MRTQLIKPVYEVKLNPFYTPDYKDKIVIDALKLEREEFKDNKAAIPNTIDFNAKTDIVKGSNYYFVNILANKISALSGRKIRPVSANEIQLFLKYDLIEDANNTYDDSGLIFYSNEYPNLSTYNHICSQMISDDWKKKFEHVELKKPFMLTGSIDIHLDNGFDNGLRIDINDFTEIYNHPSLFKGGSFDINDLGLIETGLPHNLEGGDKTLFIAGGGVRRFNRCGGLNLYAKNGNLSLSSSAGRGRFVEIFSNGNNNLVNLVKKFYKERQSKISSLGEYSIRNIKEVQGLLQ